MCCAFPCFGEEVRHGSEGCVVTVGIVLLKPRSFWFSVHAPSHQALIQEIDTPSQVQQLTSVVPVSQEAELQRIRVPG
jgi:ribosomal protein L11